MLTGRTLARVAVGLSCIFLGIYGQQELKQVGFMPIEIVSLTDHLEYVDRNKLKDLIAKEAEQGFLGLRIGHLKEEVQSLPWVKNVSVQRVWPRKLAIGIVEQQPLARWQDEYIVVTDGTLINSDYNFEDLPDFYGQDRKQLSKMIDVYMLLLSNLKPIGIAVNRLEIMPDQGWRAMLDNGIDLIIGRNEIEERLARFVVAYQSKFSIENKDVSIVDLRYTNGLAVAEGRS